MMGYWDGRCDECGCKADLISPMYALCEDCFDGEIEEQEDEFKIGAEKLNEVKNG